MTDEEFTRALEALEADPKIAAALAELDALICREAVGQCPTLTAPLMTAASRPRIRQRKPRRV